MTTDNRTNEPSEAQVEAAALEMHRLPESEGGGKGWTWYLKIARAALVAAAGVAALDGAPEPEVKP